jgi:hypothetical protein
MAKSFRNFHINKTISNEDFNKIFICKYPNCTYYYSNPVILPCCNSTICQNHTDIMDNIKNSEYKCAICGLASKKPKSGFTVNNSLTDLMKLGLHLSDPHKELIEQLNKIISIKDELALVDSELYVYNYFYEIRNQVDLHREESIRKLHDQSDYIISLLGDLEKEAKSKIVKNPSSLVKIVDLNPQINGWQTKLKQKLNESEYKEMKMKLDELYLKLKNDLNNVNKGRLLPTRVEFRPAKIDNLGHLKIDDINLEQPSKTMNTISSKTSYSQLKKTSSTILRYNHFYNGYNSTLNGSKSISKTNLKK